MRLGVWSSNTLNEGLDETPTGRVKFYNDDKGHGFIQPDDGSKDLSVRITSVSDASVADFREDRRVRISKGCAACSANNRRGTAIGRKTGLGRPSITTRATNIGLDKIYMVLQSPKV
jgi:CspA family cold shock protein